MMSSYLHWSKIGCLTPVGAFLAISFVASDVLGGEEKTGTIDLSSYAACGLNSLFVIAKWHDIDTTFKALGSAVAPRPNGESSVADLERASHALGLDPVAARLGMNDLASIPLPAIVHLKSQARQSGASHYVVLIGLHSQGVITIDPPAGPTLHPYEEFAANWTGIAVVFAANPAQSNGFRTDLRRRELWAVWPTRLALSAAVGVLAWRLFRGRARRRVRSTTVGVYL